MLKKEEQTPKLITNFGGNTCLPPQNRPTEQYTAACCKFTKIGAIRHLPICNPKNAQNQRYILRPSRGSDGQNLTPSKRPKNIHDNRDSISFFIDTAAKIRLTSSFFAAASKLFFYASPNLKRQQSAIHQYHGNFVSGISTRSVHTTYGATLGTLLEGYSAILIPPKEDKSALTTGIKSRLRGEITPFNTIIRGFAKN